MARENEINTAEAGTEQKGPISSNTVCPTWEKLGSGGDLPPFFSPNEEMKRSGFVVRFLSDQPRKESPSVFKPNTQELWFDIVYEGEVMTWTISQISLLLELKKHEPLGGKFFQVQLVPVDEAFKERWPKYKGKDRYVITAVADPKEVEAEIVA